MTRIHDLLMREGFEGSYDAVRRYVARWKSARHDNPGDGVTAFIPLLFHPGEAYQFDWSHEDVEIAGKPMRVKVAHMRLCASRAVYVRAYPREGQEMLFDAHARAFAFFGGVPSDEAAIKLLFLAIRNAGVHWKRPIEWTAAMGQFAVLFGERFVLSAS
jgi:transposase